MVTFANLDQCVSCLSTTVSQLFEPQIHNSKKLSFLRTPAFIFCLPWVRPCGNHAKCCMNEKTIQCLPNSSQHVAHLSSTNSQLFEPQLPNCLAACAHLTITVCEIERDTGRKSSFFHTPLHSSPPLGGFPSDQRHPVWCEKLEWCSYTMVKKFRRYVYSF